jgi:hypothetical protein
MIVACRERQGHKATLMNPRLIGVILMISAAPLHGPDPQPSTVALKADAQNVVKIIRGDKLKTQTYCEIAELSDRMDEEQDTKKADELSQKIAELEGKLGPEYVALLGAMNDIDPDSKDGQEIGSMFEALDRLCEK